jgi:hypothetical protein
MWIRTSVILAMLALGSFVNAAGASDLGGKLHHEGRADYLSGSRSDHFL